MCFLGAVNLCDTMLNTNKITKDTCNADPVLKMLSIQW